MIVGDDPFALHLTWTSYGTWLPGEEEGHVSNVLLSPGFLPKANQPGTPCHQGDAYTRERARRLMKDEPVFLTQEQAWSAANELVEAARKRGWRIVRAALMRNHVHVVIMDCPDDGPGVRRVLKGCSQAKLSEGHGHSRRWWTAGGSDRYKKNWAAIEAAVEYVARQKGKLVEIIDMEVRRVE